MKTAIVTGGSGGIGKETALLLSDSGYRVYDFSRTGQDASGIRHIRVDVTDEASVIAAFAQVAAESPRIDVLVNNAGFGISGAVEYTELLDARRQFDVNFFGCFLCAKAAIPYLRKSGGRIVNISSVAAVFSIPYQGFYSASKAAINSLTLSLGNELRAFGIRVCCIMPGDVRTGFTDARVKSRSGSELYPHLEHAVAAMERDEERGLSPRSVALCVRRVLRKRRPAPCYVVGGKYRLFLLLSRVLPHSLENRIVGLLYR